MTKLPNGWEVKKLEDICKLQNGFAFKSSLFSKNGVPIVRIKNIQNEKVVLEDLVYCNPNDYENDLTNYTICKNDILIAMSGATTGKIGLYDLEEKAYLNQRVGLLRISDEVTRKYIFWFLYFNSGKNLDIALGAAQPNLSTTQIHNIQIPLPPLEEQRKIVKMLDEKFASIDESIRLAKVDLLNLDELWQSILNDSFNPLKSKLDNDTYTLPPTWKWEKLENICKVTMGQSPKGESIFKSSDKIDCQVKEFHQGKIYFTDKYIENSNIVTSDIRKVATENSILLCVRAPVGEINMTKRDIAIGRGLCAISVIDFNTDFVFYYLLTLKKYLNDKATGSTFKAITVNVVKNIQIPLPPLKEQERIAKELESKAKTIKELKELYIKRLKDYEELKESLLDLAFKGGL